MNPSGRHNRTHSKSIHHGTAVSFWKKSAWWLVVCCLPFIFFCFIHANAESPDSPESTAEYKVKYAFLWGQSKYIQWPKSNTERPFVIGFYRSIPHEEIIGEIASKREIHSRQIRVKLFDGKDKIERCDVLYFPVDTSDAEMRDILTSLRDKPVLTIGEDAKFCGYGGVLSYTINEQGKLDFELNPAAAKRQGLLVDARITKLARTLTQKELIVNEEDGADLRTESEFNNTSEFVSP